MVPFPATNTHRVSSQEFLRAGFAPVQGTKPETDPTFGR